jgi:hypothetical protein
VERELNRLPRELTALAADGREVRLVDLARERPLLVAFLRHFG